MTDHAGWDGKERRHPEATTPRRARRSYRLNVFLDQLIEQRVVLAALAFAVFIILGVQSFAILNTNDQAGKGIKETRGIVEFVSLFIQKSSTAGYDTHNAILTTVQCGIAELVIPPEKRRAEDVNKCNATTIPPPDPKAIEELLKAARR